MPAFKVADSPGFEPESKASEASILSMLYYESNRFKNIEFREGIMPGQMNPGDPEPPSEREEAE